MRGNSYRQILRSSSIIGGASVINIAVGLLRMKVAALLLGPAGVGLIGLLNNIMTTGAGVAGLGVGTVGTRQIAEAANQDDPHAVWTVRRALFWLTLTLSVLGGVVFWALSDLLAVRILGDAALTDAVSWLSVAVALSVLAASQIALLNGMRRLGDIARVSVGSALLSTLVAIAALWVMGSGGIVLFVLAAPAASFLLGHWYVSKLPSPAATPWRWPELSGQWRAMLHLGFAFMVAGLASTVGQLAVRTLVQRELGIDALGHFQASWLISMTYTGLVLRAMATDYYPRLTAVIGDRTAVNRLVNEQTEVALLLAAPLLLAMLSLAPLVIRMLYSAEFMEAVEVLRWQVLGDVLKVVSWPLSFILLAAGAGRAFMGIEWLGMGVFFILSLVLLPTMGIVATGVAFLGMYALFLGAVWTLAVRRSRFAWDAIVKKQIVSLVLCAGIIRVSTLFSEWIGAGLGIVFTSVWACYGFRRLSRAGALKFGRK